MMTLFGTVENRQHYDLLNSFFDALSVKMEPFEINGFYLVLSEEQRLSIYINLESFLSEHAIKAYFLEGFDDFSFMRLSLKELLKLKNGYLYTLAQLFILGSDAYRLHALALLEQEDELLKTADMYVLALGNAYLASQALFLHRNTFNYRMKKFYDKTKIDLRNLELRNFYQSMRAYQRQ